MKETFERVTERRGKVEVPIKHFYRRQYQNAGGNWSTIYYARFKDWKGKSRTFPLGSDMKAAREALTIYEGRNVKREDFDADKVKPAPGMTIAEWADAYLELEEVKTKESFDRDCAYVKVIKRLLGSVLMTGLKRQHLFLYRTQRLKEHIIRGGKEAKKTIALAPWRTSSLAFGTC
jgi:hypothetical protein